MIQIHTKAEQDRLISYLSKFNDRLMVYGNHKLDELDMKPSFKVVRTSKDTYDAKGKFFAKQGSTCVIERFDGDVKAYHKEYRDLLVERALKRISKIRPKEFKNVSEEELRLYLQKMYQPIADWLGTRDFEETHKSFDTTISTWGNLALNEGWNNSGWSLIIGGSGTAYNNATAQLGVGNGTAVANATQTDLQGGSKSYGNMSVGFPTIGSSRDIDFKTQFGASEANHDWEEYIVRNGAGTAEDLFRKVENNGTKAMGQTFNLTVNIQIT